jgi:hypothetical protein
MSYIIIAKIRDFCPAQTISCNSGNPGSTIEAPKGNADVQPILRHVIKLAQSNKNAVSIHSQLKYCDRCIPIWTEPCVVPASDNGHDCHEDVE